MGRAGLACFYPVPSCGMRRRMPKHCQTARVPLEVCLVCRLLRDGSPNLADDELGAISHPGK
eukprot:10524615-Prorocentrum_lima.AAC.1